LRRWLWLTAALTGLVAVAAIAATSWHFSSRVVVPDHSGWPETVEVEATSPGRVVLERTDETMRPGFYGLAWQSGHAVAGSLLASDGDTVTRRLVDVNGYLLAGQEVGIDWNVFAGNPRRTRGVPFADVRVRGELGPMPAWRIPGRTRTWAIFVHGINSSAQVGLRLAPLMRRIGLESLLITYRDDLGAPESPDGLHHMGLIEWRDVEAATRYAIAHGARELVLVGYSMGGALVTQFIEKSPLADRVAALILDAPVLDWERTIEFNATEMGFPGIASLPVRWAIGARIDADWGRLDVLQHVDDFHLPILLFHGKEDDIVPIETSDDFAEDLPQWVTYYRIPRAGHTQGWNVGPGIYEAQVRRFLDEALKTNRARPVGSGSIK
jgi:uncharacterized protein